MPAATPPAPEAARSGPRPVVLVVEHHAECPPALLGDWLTAAGVSLDVRRPYLAASSPGTPGAALPPSESIAAWDGLLVLGGPMGAADDATCPWLPQTRELMRAASAAGVPTLGICLGHQLAALALGGSVEVNPRGQQLGLVDVGWTPAAALDPLVRTLAGPRRGVHWNNDVVTTLPDGAQLLAATEAGEAQVVRHAAYVWGVQLHPEADREVVAAWAASDRGSHEARGVDQDALLAQIDAGRAELDTAWRPLATAYAELIAR